jgi:hypothetical protein
MLPSSESTAERTDDYHRMNTGYPYSPLASPKMKGAIMVKIILHPMIKSASGRLGDTVFRRSHTGETSLIKLADMSKVKWSKAQKEHTALA